MSIDIGLGLTLTSNLSTGAVLKNLTVAGKNLTFAGKNLTIRGVKV